MTSVNRYSREQVLCALRHALALPRIDADEPFAEGVLEDFALDLHFAFGVTLSEEDWHDFAELAEQVRSRWGRTRRVYTLNRIAGFLADRLVAPSFGPAEIAGVRCEKAGAFLGLRALTKQLDEASVRFAPSTPIRAQLKRRELALLWERLRWITLDRLPPLTTTWVDRATWLFGVCLLALFGSGVAAVGVGAVAAVLHALSACKVSWSLLRLAQRLENPLPDGIVTFGDLARRLAEARASEAVG